MFELPASVKEINKTFKTSKITTLDKAKALYLKRYFSGSFSIDALTGGGFTYKRIIMLFGAKSSGKNALLNQTTAFTQRRCRNCHGILPEFYEADIMDYWATLLKFVVGIPECVCGNPTSKLVLFVDYEDNLAMEDPKIVTVQKFSDAKTGDSVDDLLFNDRSAILDSLKEKQDLSGEEKSQIKELEKWFKNIRVEKQEIVQMATKDYLQSCGVIFNKLLVTVPEDTEEGIEILRPIIKNKDVDMIVWDSLQGAVPRYVKEREAGQGEMGSDAKANSKLMRYVVSAYSPKDMEDESEAYKPTMFITSQVRASVGGFHAGPDTYSGGNSVAHHSVAIIEVKRDSWLKEDGTEAKFQDNFYGQRIRVRADKNKLNAPGDMYTFDYFFRKGENFNIGVDHIGELVSLGIQMGLIERAGPYYKTKGETFQGETKLKTFFRENPDFVGELYKDIKMKM